MLLALRFQRRVQGHESTYKRSSTRRPADIQSVHTGAPLAVTTAALAASAAQPSASVAPLVATTAAPSAAPGTSGATPCTQYPVNCLQGMVSARPSMYVCT